MTDILQRCLLLAALLILPPPASQAAISSVSQSLHPEHGKRYLPRAAIHVPRISSGEKGQLLPPAAALLRQLRGGSNAEDQDLPSSGGEDVRGDEGSDDRSSSAVGDVPDNAPASCPGTASEKAGKASGCDGCPNQKACASGEGAPEDPDAEAIGTRMGSIKYKVLVLSGKGGVGKSTVASQLAMALSGDGADTGLLDIDICGPSAPRMLGAEAEEVRQAGTGWQPVWVADRLCVMSIGFMLPSRRDAVVWRGARKHALVRQFLRDVEWGALEFLVVDAPPGTSDEHITLAQALRGAGAVAAVVVTTPQEVALLDVRKELSFCAKAGIPVLGLVENMAAFVCPHCAQESSIFPPAPAPGGAGAGAGGGEGLAAESGVPFLGRVPLDSALAAACEAGRAVDASAASGRALRAVAARVVQELEARFGAPA